MITSCIVQKIRKYYLGKSFLSIQTEPFIPGIVDYSHNKSRIKNLKSKSKKRQIFGEDINYKDPYPTQSKSGMGQMSNSRKLFYPTGSVLKNRPTAHIFYFL
jgi:hypothetical protein